MKIPLSVIVNTKNNADTIRRCLASCASWASDLIVVDMGSNDDTTAIARQFTNHILSVRPMERFVLARNVGLHAAKETWTFILDADEEIPEALRDELETVISADDSRRNAYYVPRRNRIFGRWLKGGAGWPDYQLRLARRGAIRYTHYFHRAPDVIGEIGFLSHPLLHYHYDRPADFLRRMRLYISRDAEEAFEDGERTNLLDVIARPTGLFLFLFVRHGGWRDGWRGLVFALLHTRYKYLNRRALLRLQHRHRKNYG